MNVISAIKYENYFLRLLGISSYSMTRATATDATQLRCSNRDTVVGLLASILYLSVSTWMHLYAALGWFEYDATVTAAIEEAGTTLMSLFNLVRWVEYVTYTLLHVLLFLRRHSVAYVYNRLLDIDRKLEFNQTVEVNIKSGVSRS